MNETKTNYRCYKALIEDKLKYYIQSYGNEGNHAIGFEGDESAIEKAYNMICNFNFKKPPSLKKVYENLFYVFLPEEKFKICLQNYFAANLAFDKEDSSFYSEDENGIIYNYAKISIVAKELSEKFFVDNINRKCFINHVE